MKTLITALNISFLLIFTSLSTADAEMAAQSTASKQPKPTISVVTAENIYENCKGYFTKKFVTRENIGRTNMCNGFFYGFSSALLQLQRDGYKIDLCLPEDLTTTAVVKAFLDWSEANKTSLKTPAQKIVLQSLRAAYPCNGSNQSNNDASSYEQLIEPSN